MNSLQVLQINDKSEDEYHKSTPDCCKCLKSSAIPRAILMSIWDKIYSIILVFICVVVAISFTIPIIIYGADSDRRSSGENHDNATISISKLDPKTCVDANDFQVSLLMCYS